MAKQPNSPRIPELFRCPLRLRGCSREDGFMNIIRWSRNSALVLLWVCAFFSLPARSQEFPVTTRTLKNGMKVLVQSDHSIPSVALYIFYRFGSRNEGPVTTGISH